MLLLQWVINFLIIFFYNIVLAIVGNKEDWEFKRINVLENKDDNEVKKILFEDWNKGKNKYGVLKERNK